MWRREHPDNQEPLFLGARSLQIRERVRRRLGISPLHSESGHNPLPGTPHSAKSRIYELLYLPNIAASEYGRAIASHATESHGNGRRWAERAFLILGLLGVGLWLGSMALTRVYEAWDSHQFDREMRASLERRGVSPAPKAPKGEFRPIPEGTLIGRLSIPRLHLNDIVRQGASEETLRVALGHVQSTALPGQGGNVAVAGHRDTLFRVLRKIRPNDSIVFETTSGRYEYKVESTQIVSPTNISVLDASSRPELTLITCYPFFYVGPAPKRFIVRARQVSKTGPVLEARRGS